MSPGSAPDMTRQTRNHVNLNAGLAGGKPELPAWARDIR